MGAAEGPEGLAPAAISASIINSCWYQAYKYATKTAKIAKSSCHLPVSLPSA